MFLLFGTPFRQRCLLLLQRLDPLCLRLAFSGELRKAFRLLAFTFALGRNVFLLALALYPFEFAEPLLLLGPAAAHGLGLLFELLDSFAFLLASVLILFAQTFELLGDLLLVDDHGLHGLDPGTGHHGRLVSESDDEHRHDNGMKQQRVYDGQQAIGQGFPAHRGIPCGASVISPTLGAPARCRIVIRVTTSP